MCAADAALGGDEDRAIDDQGPSVDPSSQRKQIGDAAGAPLFAPAPARASLLRDSNADGFKGPSEVSDARATPPGGCA